MGKKKEKAATTEAERGEPRRVEGLRDSGTTEETAAEVTVGVVNVVKLSDDLVDPKVWLAEIHNMSDGTAEFAVQVIGKDEKANWLEVNSEDVAREQIKLHLDAAGIEMEPPDGPEETAVEEPEPKETGLIVGRRDLIGPAQQLPVEEIEFEHLLSSSEFANAPRIVFVDGDDQKVLIDRVNAPEAEK